MPSKGYLRGKCLFIVLVGLREVGIWGLVVAPQYGTLR
jgi:hypothetical protein